jgi:hypothetical protein
MKSNAVRVGPDSGRITISGNNFSSSYIGQGKDKRQPDDQTAAGLVLSESTDVLVTGNVFAGLDPPAVDHKGDQPSVMANNYFIETDADIPTVSIDGPTFDRNRSTNTR